MKDCIFNFSNPACKIKGIMSAVVDIEEVLKLSDFPFAFRKDFGAEVIGIIWIDENHIWQWKMRIEFPSGNKQVVYGDCGKNSDEDTCLNEMQKLPMKEFYYFPNAAEDVNGLIEIMKKNDLIKSLERIEINR